MIESMTWITPLLAITSGVITMASLTLTPFPLALMVTSSPWTVVAAGRVSTSAAVTRPGTTW